MKVVEESAKSVEEAIEEALRKLEASRDRVEIEILEQPSRGLLGLLGNRPARVRVLLKETAGDRARGLISQVIGAMDVEAEILVEEDEKDIKVNLEGERLGLLIGRRGETLNALQYLVNLAVNKDQAERKRIIVDIEGYRQKREDTLVALAHRVAEKARQRGRSVVLGPMSAQERRIIHTTLRERDDIYTFSEGEEPYRKIIIAPRK